jgi:hypothetical protein
MDSPKEDINENKIISPSGGSSFFSDKNSIILVLIALLLLSFLGINLIKGVGDFVQYIINGIAYFLRPLLSDVSFITGTVIDSSSDIIADASKTGIDIAQGTAQSVGDLFIRASDNEPHKEVNKVPLTQVNVHHKDEKKEKKIDDVINSPKPPPLNIPKADSTTNPIQKPITSNKTGWCLIDEYEGQRNCISVGEEDKCMSQQVYPTQKMCLNPTLTK